MAKLFISYAHADSTFVNEVAKALREAGHEVWIDTHGIQGGTLWGSEIAKAILGCDVFLLFVSPKSIDSDYVRREVDFAFSEKRKILPVMLENVDLPLEFELPLAGIQYVDYRAADWKSRLLTALGNQPVRRPGKVTGKLRNPYSSLPVLEPIERLLILSNREKELKRGIDHLSQHRLLLVTGMPGIGKSTFARALLEFIPAGSPPPFWYNFERQRTSGNSLSVLLDHLASYLDVCLDADVRRHVMAFRTSPGGNASVNDVDVLISFLNQEKPIWLVFDNLETVLSQDTYEFLDEGVELLFDSLKTSTHNAKIIITNPFVPILRTGEVFLEAGTSALILEGLNDDFTFAFLRAFGLQDRSKEELEPLIREINGHPFALNHIARYIQAVGSGVILADLPGGLEEINERFGDFLKGRLSAQEFTTLQTLSVLNREVTVPGLCQIAQVRPNVIMHLREKGLLQVNEADKFWLHNIVRNSLKPTEPDLLKKAHLRAMNFFRNQELPRLPERIDDYASILEWHHHAVEAGDAISAYSALYSTGLKEQLLKWNEYDLLVRLCEATFRAVYQVEANVSQIEANLSSRERINVYHDLGTAYFLMGDSLKSITHLKSALNLLPEQDDEDLRINLLIELSESYNGSRDSTSAMDLCQKAEDLLTNSQNESLHAKFLHLRGIIHRDKGDLVNAASDLKEALKLYQTSRDQTHTANITGDLGIVYYLQNQFEEAVSYYQQAITASEANQDLRGAMIGYFNIGDVYLLGGEYAAACKDLRTALDISRKKKISWMEVNAGLYLTEALIALADYDRAQELLNALRPMLRKQASRCFSGLELTLDARLCWKRNQMDQARIYYKQAFELLENAAECQYECARAYISYAEFLAESGRKDSAELALQKGRRIFEEQNNKLGLDMIDKSLLIVR